MASNADFKIDKGMEIPSAKTRPRQREYPFDLMEIGDSIFFGTQNAASVRSSVMYYGKRNRKSFVTR
jgi:hypothetical protein